MNTDFTAFGRQFQLLRYPAGGARELQAWDTADDYLLDQVEPVALVAGQPIVLFNDSFGALAIALDGYSRVSVTDSWIAQKALLNNLAHNRLTADAVRLQDCLSPLPDKPQLVLLKVPKSLALLEHQLAALQAVVTPQTRIIAGGKVRDIHNSTLALFERYLGPTRTSLARKKARLIFSAVESRPPQPSPKSAEWPLEGTPYRMSNHANVFSRSKLDIGARFMLAHLPRDLGDARVIDLGCGNGVLGLMLLHHNADIELTLVDESLMALSSAADNIARNRPQQLDRCRFVASNCLEEIEPGPVDCIICNPPFHQQQTITAHIAEQMFADAHRHLKPGGQLLIVGNRHLGYHVKLRRQFGNCHQVASDPKFVILAAYKRQTSPAASRNKAIRRKRQ